MNNLILYLLQSGISIILLYGIYWFFLRNDTFHMVNRIYLVVTVIFSLLFPLLHITLPFNGADQSTFVVMLDAVTINATSLQTTLSSHLNTFQIISIIYLTGAGIFLVRFIFQLGQIMMMVHKYGISREEGLNIVFIDRNYAPFSFFNLIFINHKEVNDENVKEIITHEQVHIKQRHSFDLILLEMLTIIQWFNPLVWLYRNSIKSIHEYLADEGVLVRGYDAINYQNLLLHQSMGIQVNELTNNFNHSLIKKRIIMMTKSKSTFIAKFKVVLVTPVALFLVLAFTASPMVQSIAQVDNSAREAQEIQQSPPQVKPDEQIFTVVEVMPKYPGGDEARMQYLQQSIIYPEAARKSGKQGTVYVTYVVEKDGSISNVELLRGFDKECDEEALKVVKNMPNWEPGLQRGKPVRVKYNIPIRFSLSGEKEVEKDIEKDTDSDVDKEKDMPPPPPKPERVVRQGESGTPPPPPPPSKQKADKK
jgi:TonB family protein